jgi:hypothetical protein
LLAVQSSDDIAIVSPRCAASVGRLAQHNGGAAVNRNLFQCAVGKKADPFTVG